MRQFGGARGGIHAIRGHADRERTHLRQVAAPVDGKVLPLDARFQRTVHGVQKVVAVRLNVKADQVRAEQPVQQFVLPRADPEGLGIRPRDVPENGHARVGALFLDHRGKQREMVVLYQYDGTALRRDLFQQGHRRTCD